MAKDKFTVDDLEQELRRREAKAPASKPARRKEYANADRYGEDGRRIYSGYDAAAPAPTAQPPEHPAPRRWRIAALALAFIVSALIAVVFIALPH